MQTAESRSQESGVRIVAGSVLNIAYNFLNENKFALAGDLPSAISCQQSKHDNNLGDLITTCSEGE